jgi:signal transduction histidine kinase
MNLNGNGSVVLRKEQFPIAILTQSDIIKALGEKSNLSMNIYHYATQSLISVDENSPIEFALKLFTKHNIRRIVLTNHKKEFSGVALQERLFRYMGEDISKIEFQQEIERRLEKEYLLMQQSKLATMGEMIGHIAHQWRQPLAELGGVFMNLDSAYEFDELHRDYFKEKVKNGNELIKYMSHTIEDFRNFFTPNCDQASFELSTYIQSAINIIEATLTYHHIQLQIIAPKAPIYLSGYPSEFSQVLLNLLNNAKDVLVERKIPHPTIIIETQTKGEETIISIEDNAGGIKEEIIESIFDIYFSTKINTGGSGLGLYISKLIIESKMIGKIEVANTKRGAKFTIIL